MLLKKAKQDDRTVPLSVNLDLRNADTISLYIWDENQKPLCNKLTYPITVSE